jgi:hypothetical protein
MHRELRKELADIGNPIDNKRPGDSVPNNLGVKVNTQTVQ